MRVLALSVVSRLRLAELPQARRKVHLGAFVVLRGKASFGQGLWKPGLYAAALGLHVCLFKPATRSVSAELLE